MTAVILQARIDSSRLPGKALLLLDGEPVVFRVMEALNHVSADLRVLACTEDSYSSFEPLTKKAGFDIFSGSKEDVLNRFCRVIRKYSIDRIIRATGDNPFVFADAACAINNEALSHNADYAGYTGLPYGAGVESAAALALLRAEIETVLPYDHEHVCPYLYNHPELFNIHRPSAPAKWNHPNIRLTIDTQEDFDRAAELYSALPEEKLRYNGETIINKYREIFH
ncbi:MAG: spore coat protein [Treponema sp.]|nr:spore coat protein [Treponema sp.]